MQAIMGILQNCTGSLWKTAAMRFAENLLVQKNLTIHGVRFSFVDGLMRER